MIEIDGKQLYTVDEAAALLGMGTRTIRNKIKDGIIKAVVISGVKHISRDELKAATQQRKEAGKRGTETSLCKDVKAGTD